jgi:hypothetical protein
LQLALSVLLFIEAVLLVKLIGEGVGGNVSLFVGSVGILVCCLLVWREIPVVRWLLVALVGWRLVRIGLDMAAHFAPGDHRIPGTLILIALYVAAGTVVASPLGRPSVRAAD